MGREIYGGNSDGKPPVVRAYGNGVRAGALGLMLNSVVLGVMSLGVESVEKFVGGVKKLWGIDNFILAICLALSVVMSKVVAAERGNVDVPNRPSAGVLAGVSTLFSVMGIPLAMETTTKAGDGSPAMMTILRWWRRFSGGGGGSPAMAAVTGAGHGYAVTVLFLFLFFKFPFLFYFSSSFLFLSFYFLLFMFPII
ncbi:Sucrose transport protein SUC5 [Linum perenne]